MGAEYADPHQYSCFGLNNVQWLLAEVTFTRDERGTRANLIMMPKEAFAVQPYQFYSRAGAKSMNDGMLRQQAPGGHDDRLG